MKSANGIYKTFFRVVFIWLFTFAITSCSDDFLERNPTDQLSESSFWATENDALLALTGVYHDSPKVGTGPFRYSFWSGSTLLRLDLMTDNGDEKDRRLEPMTNGTLTSGYWIVEEFWGQAWDKIVRCNAFLDHIGAATIDEQSKSQMVAEVRFIRAYYYFWMTTFWGDVPLVTSVASYSEANSIGRTPKSEVVQFVLDELTEAAEDLPVSRPNDEYGRVTRAAALAIKGRLQMSEKDWSGAADTYKNIIDLNQYQIAPFYKELFEDDGERNNEVILAFTRLDNVFGEDIIKHCIPAVYGGWHQFNVFNNLVEDYEMTDGLTTDQSPLYDPMHPYDNRDPRLDMTVFISQRSVFRGTQLYDARPNSPTNDALPRRHWTGYGLRKFADEDYTGSVDSYGADFPVVRYAEVLLSYLESKLEAGDPIDQNLLDQTINQVRGRATVNMPPVTETDPTLLRDILRRERRVELAFEGLRLYDLFRWRTAQIKLNEPVFGMKLTDDPQNYDGGYQIDDEGYYFYEDPNFREDVDYLWPIPQTELDINPNLGQNPSY